MADAAPVTGTHPTSTGSTPVARDDNRVIWLLLAAAFVGLLAGRQPLRVDVIRDRSVLAREVEGGMIENVYRLQIINASESPVALQLGAQGLDGSLVYLLEILLRAGIAADPAAAPPVLDGTHGQYIEQRQGYSFPVIFRGES